MNYLKNYALGFLFLFACNTTAEQSFDKDAMLANVTYTALESYDRFALSVATMQTLSAALQQSPNPANLEKLRQAWKESTAAWKACELLNFGITKDKNYMFEINFNEVRPKLIENVLADTSKLDASQIKSLGAAAKGLPSIAYLLFEKQKELLETSKNERIMSFLCLLTENLSQNALALKEEWAKDKEYTKSFVRNENNVSLNMFANQLLALSENLATKRMNDFIGQLKDSTKNDGLEKALNDKQFVISALESIKNVFDGGKGAGFDDYLDFLNAKFTNRNLSTAINEQIEKAKTALQMADNEEKAKIAQDELKKLLILIKTDMFSILSIPVSFTDADGD